MQFDRNLRQAINFEFIFQYTSERPPVTQLSGVDVLMRSLWKQTE